MIHDSIEFHNVAELMKYPGMTGLALHRYPECAIRCLTTLGHHAAACSDGVELRFVSGAEWLSLTLSARSNYPFSSGAQVEVARGDFIVSSHTIHDGATQTLKLMMPPLFREIEPEAFCGGRFAQNVWRVRFSNATIFYHGLDTAGQPCRPPHANEKPRYCWLAYGSSITNSTPGYISHAARHLGIDIQNKGLCGSCFCEPAAADYLAACEGWDFATLELGVNQRDSVSVEDFEIRVRHLVSTLRAAAPNKPLILITIFPNGDDYRIKPNRASTGNREFRACLRQIHRTSSDPHLYLLEGDTVLDQFAGLSADLIHPSSDGYQLMGANLARLLEPILAENFGNKFSRPPHRSHSC